ncbi:MAG: GDP-mannose 4,6-dehydratase [marine benthic group bacterium]|jgi:GDP-4-dehydro-6-deoxy-D-mannose reductase|nr:GDP-mannose 4,6-dehydratase [Candidatus Benthicola marisminoris]
MKALVTGADGFVGQHLVAELLDHGVDVSASVLDLPPSRSTLSVEQMALVEWKAADVLDQDALVRVVAAAMPDQIYHLAGFASGALARQFASDAVHINAGGTVNLCEAVLAVRENKPDFDPRILVMGSADAYGDAARGGDPITEDMSLRPVSVYGLSKAGQELAAHTYRRAHGLRVLVARGFNLVGPGQEPPFVVPEFAVQLARISAGELEPVVAVGNLEVRRDFTDVRDGVRAFRMLMDLDAPGAAYNVASGEAIRIGSLLDWIIDEAGVEVEIEVTSSRVRREELDVVVGDSTRLREATGWKPGHDIEASVRETYRWMKGRFVNTINDNPVV